ERGAGDDDVRAIAGDQIDDVAGRVPVLAHVVVAAVDRGDDPGALAEGLLEHATGPERPLATTGRGVGRVLGADAREELVQVVHDPERGHERPPGYSNRTVRRECP